MMSYINSENDIRMTMRLVESHEDSTIRLNANGGNSVLIVCDPLNEVDYIETITNLMDTQKYYMIDMNKLLCKFVTTQKELIEESFELLKGSINQIFRAPAGEEGDDLIGFILEEISSAFSSSKIPVLINMGALYGSGIDGLHIMENELVMNAQLPLIILYPATRESDKLMFLGKRPASKYRCMIVN